MNKSEPDFQVKTVLSKDSTEIASVPCKIWLPKHVHERPLVVFETSCEAYRDIYRVARECDLKAEVIGFNSNVETLIVGKKVYLTQLITRYTSADQQPITTFKGEPTVLTTYNYLKSDQLQQERKTYIYFDLTDNFLLRPGKSITRSYTGEVKVKDVRKQISQIKGIGQVIFDQHFYDIELGDGGVTTYSKLVAVLKSEIGAQNTDEIESMIKPRIDDYVLLASFASNQRTNITGWAASDDECATRTYFGYVSVQPKTERVTHTHDDVLIDLRDFSDFMNVALTTFYKFSDEQADLFRGALYKILPSRKRTVESSILTYFLP